jgi:hypothetical protein
MLAGATFDILTSVTAINCLLQVYPAGTLEHIFLSVFCGI